MKQTLLLLIFILSYNASNAAKWIKIDSVRTNMGRYDMACFGENLSAYTYAKSDIINTNAGPIAYKTNIIRYTTNKGKDWQRMYTDSTNVTIETGFKFLQIGFFNKNTVIALSDKGFMLRTTNLGKNWDTLKFKKNSGDPSSLRCYENGQGMFRLGATLYLTENSGEKWTTMQHPPDRDSIPMIYGGCDRFQDTIILNAYAGLVSKSAYHYSKVSFNKGKTWEYFDGVKKRRLTNQKFINGKVGFRTGDSTPYTNQDPAVIYKTINSGKTWKPVYENNTIRSAFYNIEIIDDNNIIVTSNNCIVISNDQGNTWKNITSTESEKNKNIIKVASSSLKNIMLFRYRGYIYNYDYYSSVEDKTFSKENIAVFPNPVRNSEALNIQLPEDMNGQANITILNMLGQQLYRMSDTYTNSINLNLPNNLASGNYIIQIEMNNKTYSKTFIVAE